MRKKHRTRECQKYEDQGRIIQYLLVSEGRLHKSNSEKKGWFINGGPGLCCRTTYA